MHVDGHLEQLSDVGFARTAAEQAIRRKDLDLAKDGDRDEAPGPA